MPLISEIVLASDFERNASFDDSWLALESCELPRSPGGKIGLTSTPKSKSLWQSNK